LRFFKPCKKSRPPKLTAQNIVKTDKFSKRKKFRTLSLIFGWHMDNIFREGESLFNCRQWSSFKYIPFKTSVSIFKGLEAIVEIQAPEISGKKDN
tara:strand:+ start:401 stop:685 length:285 start_codon:yes stop_codon:yes gene_type:complete